MKDKAASFFWTLMIGVFFLGIVFRKAGLENDNSIFSYIGFVLMICSGIYFLLKIYAWKKELKEAEQELNIAREDFKRDAQQIRVQLQDIKIRLKNIIEALPDKNFHYLENKLPEGVEEVYEYIFEIKLPDGQQINYPLISYRDKATLQMTLWTQKETTFYVGQTDISVNYLDLNFLNE